ncbi:MAG: hypothetical protein LBU44_03575 [Mediterranea sp.]|jgi:hypothetical protein|nr:hypothetical protein [Mediterranea sp.]
MKRIKIAFVAMLAVILMGVTFTSCLKSEKDNTIYAYVTINTSMGYIARVTTDDGYRLEPQNALQMILSNGSIPERAYIAFELLEGETLSLNAPAKISFKQYYDILYVRDMSPDPVETVTPLLALSESIWSANEYLNVAAAYYTYTGDSPEDFSLYIDKVEENIIYFKIAFTRTVEKSPTYSTKSLSFILDSEENIKTEYPDLTPDSNGYYSAVLIADGVNQSGEPIDLKSNTSKIKFPN